MKNDKNPETTASFGLIIDKPEGITSHDAIQRIRALTGIRRVGHAGTLDPFATGVLIVMAGKATRLAEYVQSLPKTYTATIRLGKTSTTDDIMGTITPYQNTGKLPKPTQKEIEIALHGFTGIIKQTPPLFSALKSHGKRLYEYARKDTEKARVEAEKKAREVTIHSLSLLAYRYPEATIQIICSSGTYVRSLGRDIGEKLQTGAYVKCLRRNAIGQFNEKQSAPLQEITAGDIEPLKIPVNTLVEHLDKVRLSPENVAKFIQGKALELPANLAQHTNPVSVCNQSNTLIGIGSIDAKKNPPALSPVKVCTFMTSC